MVKAFLLVFSLLSLNLFAQENKQDIEKEILELRQLNKTQDKEEKEIDQMLDICKEIYSREPDLVLSYLDNLEPLIEKKNYYRIWDDYCYLIQKIYTGKGEFKKAEGIITAIYSRHSKNFTLEEEVSIKFNLVSIACNLGEIERSQAIIKEILPKAQSDFQKASLYYQRAANYKDEGEYKKSTEDGLRAIDLYKSIRDWKNVAVTYDFLGLIYNEIKDYKKALYYARQGLKFAKTSRNHLGEVTSYANMGVYHRALKQIDSALYYYNLSAALAKEYNSIQSLAQNLMNIGNIYSSELHNYSEAKKYYKQSLNICSSSGIQYGVYLNWYNLGTNYQLAGEYEEAKSAYDSAAFYAAKLKTPSGEADVQKAYYILYKNQGNYIKALSHYEKFNEINQQINLEQSKKEITELQAKYDIAVKDKEIEQINNEYKVQKFRNGILILVIVFGLLGACSVIYFLVYRNKSLRKLYERNVELSQSSLFEIPEIKKEEGGDPMKKIFENLVDLMENEKIYKEPNLTITSIAAKLQTNRNYLSSSIASYANMNFNNFINSYRVREAKRIILQDSTLSLNEVMYICGFNSRTPFYMAFQKYTGMSPQQFKDLSVSKKSRHHIEEGKMNG